MGERPTDEDERVDALTHCPLCGLQIDHINIPGIIDPWEYDAPLMLNPCTCAVRQEILRNPNSWVQVVDESSTIGVRSGIKISREYSGDGIGPVAGDFDEVAVYDGVDIWATEVARYSLSDVHCGVADHAE